MSERVKIAVIAPNELIREGLRRILTAQDFDVCAVASDSEDLLARLGGEPVQIVVVDGLNGERTLKTCLIIRQVLPDSRIVMIISDIDVELVVHCFTAGVAGILLEETSCEQLGGVLRLVMLGQRIMPPEIVEKLGEPAIERSSVDWKTMSASVKLSERETEILKCLVAGEANKIISRRLNITEATVKVHIKAILRKLHVMNRTQAAIWAVVRGLSRIEGVPSWQSEPEPTVHSLGA